MTIEQDKILYFANFIKEHLGIIYADANMYQLEHRLNDICYQLGFKTIDELYQNAHIVMTSQMKELILDLATNNETSFFRDSAMYTALREFVFPELINKTHKGIIDIWSAACSSGQEVYSIMMEYQLIKEKNPIVPMLNLLATDISGTILKRAKSGTYTQLDVQRGLPAKYLIQFFDKLENDNWQVKPTLQRGIDFAKLNLLENWDSIGTFDVIFCRNVLIYQNIENRIKVIDKIFNKLNSGGFLILGASESLLGLSEKFNQVSTSGTIIYQKKA